MTNKLADAANHRKNRQYQQALDIYASLWKVAPGTFSGWDGWGYAFCLKETGQYAEALEICRQLYRRFPDMPALRQLYAWCIYHTQLANSAMPDEGILQKAVAAIVQLCPPNDDPYSPAARSILKLAKQMAGKPQPNWPAIEQWLLQLDPDRLDQKPFGFLRPDGKKNELASALEEWYSLMTKTLVANQKWEECITVCDAATARGLQWHYGNDIWFGRRKAFALAKMGHRAKAGLLLQELCTKKREWFLLQDLASYTEDPGKAISLLAMAALLPGEPAMKIRLYTQLGQSLAAAGNTTAAHTHLQLVAAIRRQQGWPADAQMEAALQQDGKDNTPAPSLNGLLRQAKELWQQLSAEGQERHKGTIRNLLPNGKAGIVKAANGQTYYFSMMELRMPREKVKPGMEVGFGLRMGFDKKKNRAVENAVDLVPA